MSHVCRLTIRYRVPRAHLNTYTCAGTCEDNGEFKSCQDVHDTIKAATGQVPASGNYAVQGRTQLWKVFCEIDKDGGWLRLGIGENLLEESCKVPCFHCLFCTACGCAHSHSRSLPWFFGYCSNFKWGRGVKDGDPTDAVAWCRLLLVDVRFSDDVIAFEGGMDHKHFREDKANLNVELISPSQLKAAVSHSSA